MLSFWWYCRHWRLRKWSYDNFRCSQWRTFRQNVIFVQWPPFYIITYPQITLHWRHNDHGGVSNHHPHDCLSNRLFRRRSKKTSKLRVTGLCERNSPGPVNSPHKGSVTRKMVPFDDVIMIWLLCWCYDAGSHHSNHHNIIVQFGTNIALWLWALQWRHKNVVAFPIPKLPQTLWEKLMGNLRIIRTYPLQWRHNGRDSVSNYQPPVCLLSRVIRRRSKKTSKLRVTGLCVGNSPETGEFPAQRASNAENTSIWWRHHALTGWLIPQKANSSFC